MLTKQVLYCHSIQLIMYDNKFVKFYNNYFKNYNTCDFLLVDNICSVQSLNLNN